jgi:hypothetical protein
MIRRLPKSFRGGSYGHKALGSLALFVALGAISMAAPAATLERRSLLDLAKGAELIVDGTVVSRKVEALGSGQGARTCFKIAVAEVIAGADPGKSIRLCFFGGEINGRGYGVAGMRYPSVGERGIYLVESLHQAMLNPLVGWDQGRFLLVRDAASGTLKVATAAGQRITDLSPEAAQPTAASQDVVSSGGATAAGVLSDDSTDLRGAVSRDEFVAKLRSYHGG